MVKEAKNIDFYTSGKQPTEEDFARISMWIKKQKLALAEGKKAAKKQSSKLRPTI